VKDFEGQRLAEMLTTVLLGAAGVRVPLSRSMTELTTLDRCFLDRLLHTRHPPDPVRWARWHCPHLPRDRPAVALLQQEPRGLAASKQREAGIQHRRRWAEGRIDVIYHTAEVEEYHTWKHFGKLLRLNGIAHSTMERICHAATPLVLL
jgi:hypothetical protein